MSDTTFDWMSTTTDTIPTFDFDIDSGFDYTFDSGTGYTYNMTDPSDMFVFDDAAWQDEYDNQFNTDYDSLFVTPETTETESGTSAWDMVNTPLGTGLILGGISGMTKAIAGESASEDAQKRSEDERAFVESQKEADRQHALEIERMREEARMEEIEALKKEPGKADPTTSSLGALPSAPYRRK